MRYEYWGMEKSTCLFRVNRQVSAETSEIFYSVFPFQFSQSISIKMVSAILRDTLTPYARSLTRVVMFNVNMRITQGPFPQGDEENRWRALEAVVVLGFAGIGVPNSEEGHVVDRAVKILSPLRGMKALTLKGSVYDNAQRKRIVREVQESMGCL